MIKKLFKSGYLLVFIFITTSKAVYAQEYFSLNIDNDLYFKLDRYYSSGIFLQYGKQLQPKEASSEIDTKKFLLWELGQELYTPNDRYTSDTNLFDYPYGGWSFLKLTFQKEHSLNKQTQWGIQLGVTGSASGAKWMQNNYHRLILGLPELVWTDEVPEAFHVNFFTDSYKRWNLRQKVAVQSHVFTTMGTQNISAGGALGLALGEQTVLTKQGNVLIDNQQGEGVYFGLRVQFIAHDYMLSGSLFNDNARFTLPVNRLRATIEAGYAVHKNNWRLALIYFNRSPDNKTQPQKGHHYLNITISRFFDTVVSK